MKRVILIIFSIILLASCTLSPQTNSVIRSLYPNAKIYTDSAKIQYIVINEDSVFIATLKCGSSDTSNMFDIVYCPPTDSITKLRNFDKDTVVSNNNSNWW